MVNCPMNSGSFLNYVDNAKSKNTVKSYRNGLKHFALWYQYERHGKEQPKRRSRRDLWKYITAILNSVLEERREQLGSDNPEQRRIMERLIEQWHRHQTRNGASVNSARCRYVAVAQFFKFYDLDLKASMIPSEVKKTVISQTNYRLTVSDLKKMFQAADLRGRAILLMAKDLGLRIDDFSRIEVSQLPDLDAEPPVSFNVETGKEHVWSQGFLSAETVPVLRAYLESLKDRQCSYCRGRGCRECDGTGKKKQSPYLWPSNGDRPMTENGFRRWLKDLAQRAGIKTSPNQRLTFQCFRKLLMRAGIETGVGLTAVKMMVGKSVAQSDATYIVQADLRDAFKKVSKFLNVSGVEEAQKPLKDMIVQQEREMASLRKRMKMFLDKMKEQDDLTHDLKSNVDKLNLIVDKLAASGGLPDWRTPDGARKLVEQLKKNIVQDYGGEN